MAGGAADTAGTAADGTVIIDSELGQRCPASFATAPHAVGLLGSEASVFCFKPICEELFLRRFLVVGLCLPLGSGHAAELKLAGDLSRVARARFENKFKPIMDAASRFSPASR